MQEIPIQDIEINTGRRSVDGEVVARIAHSVLEIGLLNPIILKVKPGGFVLVAGLHRLEAFKLLERESIPAHVAGFGDSLDAELAEIDENLQRNDLTILEQAEHLDRREEILDEKGKRPKAGGQPGNSNAATVKNEGVPGTPSFVPTADLAKSMGMSKSTAYQRLQIARNLDDETKELIRGTPIADSKTQLLTLARMSHDEQAAIVKHVEDTPKLFDRLNSGGKITVDNLIKEVRAVELKEERAEIAQAAQDITPSDRWAVYQADMQSWQSPQQYDFIITDPPYPKEYISLYEVMAANALDWLKPGGLLLAMCGQSYLEEICELMSAHLSYYWTGAYMTPGQPTPLRHRQVNTTWKPILMFTKPDEKYSGKIFGDVFTSDGNDKDFHKWGQSVSGMYSIISKVCTPGQSILDPFCGAGTTGIAALKFGCLFDGVELEEENADISRTRLANYDEA